MSEAGLLPLNKDKRVIIPLDRLFKFLYPVEDVKKEMRELSLSSLLVAGG
jgi:hypothetical protein